VYGILLAEETLCGYFLPFQKPGGARKLTRYNVLLSAIHIASEETPPSHKLVVIHPIIILSAGTYICSIGWINHQNWKNLFLTDSLYISGTTTLRVMFVRQFLLLPSGKHLLLPILAAN
jgi:hypothetical protein